MISMFGELAVLREGFRVQRRVIFALILREMSTRFGKSSLGYIWAVIMPFALIMLKTAMFSFIGRSPDLGQSFTLFFATGLVPFLMFSHISNGVGKAVSSNKALLGYPHVKEIDTFFARGILESATLLVAALFILVVLHIQEVDYVVRSFLELFGLIGVIVMFSVGLGMVNAQVFEYLPSYEQFFSMIRMPLFFLSGIFYIADTLPIMVREILIWNPLLQFSEWMRSIFYHGFDSPYVNHEYLFAWSFGLFFIGMALTKLNEGKH